jgi:hydroxymethylpyrimidine pyrophosphatase-like HAD family hydrolase
VVGEMGASWINEGEDSWEEEKDELMILPKNIMDEMQTIAKQYPKTMFFDTSKHSMATIEMKKNVDSEKYLKDQHECLLKINHMLSLQKMDAQVSVSVTRIAINVAVKNAGKARGSERILELCSVRHLRPTQIMTFGDDVSDFAMADVFYDRGLPVEFIYVGEPEAILNKKYSYPVKQMKLLCDEGTSEFFQHISRFH